MAEWMVRVGDELVPIKGRMQIGRASTSDLALAGAEVSRKHATLYTEGEVLMVKDDGSSTGTTLNGVPLAQPQRCRHADRIGIGRHVLMVMDPARVAREILPTTMEHKPRPSKPVSATRSSRRSDPKHSR